jgi:hypothetical protein
MCACNSGNAKTTLRWREVPPTVAVAVACALVSAPLGADPLVPPAPDPYADAPPYLRPLSPSTTVGAILTTGQCVEDSRGRAGEMFRFVGIPDGLGLALGPVRPPGPDKIATLWVNHEMAHDAGTAAGPLPHGARITMLRLTDGASWERKASSEKRPRVVVGGWAIERVSVGEPPVRVGPIERGFAKFCSAFLADARVGFDPPLFLTGEEDVGPHTFEPAGGQVFALDNGNLWAVPRLGRAMWENAIVAPFTGDVTVVFGLEDGPEDGDALHSQLYMYMGGKQRNTSDPLARNGLRGGILYVLVADDAAFGSEASLRQRGESVRVHWLPVPWDADDVTLDAAAKAAGAFGFVRIEDGACDPVTPGALYFVTTGRNGTCNPRGRLYRYRFEPRDPLAGGTLEILLDGSEGVVGPDNIDLNRHGELAIQEDPGRDLRDLGLRRDSSVWIYTTKRGGLHRIATMNRAAATRHALAADPANRDESSQNAPGLWESTGIIDAEWWLGRGAWLCAVQAHSLRIAPVETTVQGGQVLWLRWR